MKEWTRHHRGMGGWWSECSVLMVWQCDGGFWERWQVRMRRPQRGGEGREQQEGVLGG